MRMQIDPNFSTKVELIGKDNYDGDVSDNISIYIGFSLIILGVLNGITDVPDAFIVGATLSGLCFTAADFLILGVNLKMFIKPFTMLGIFCLFLLPIILLVYPHPSMLVFFWMFSDMGTFCALGLVMIALGIKSGNAKDGFIIETLGALNQLKTNNSILRDEMDAYIREHAELNKEYQELKKEHQEFIMEHKELMDKVRTKMTNLEEEFKNNKEPST